MPGAQHSAWHKGGFRTYISHMSRARPIKPIKIELIIIHCGHTGRSVPDNVTGKSFTEESTKPEFWTHIPKALGKSPNSQCRGQVASYPSVLFF